ncbi:hypothetical protein PPYR_15345 [Photinus pyralis]|uniref:Uncharacterized protein n=1 Tax=Photinus pyralis TaxID=7054 RepID=A0A5N3ZZ36_PHOPY|nr:uncharacterized protein LOC116182342 [Photinus pyralis]XP_031359101.1 uncharacterized protein LOC116182699 [Photinus pyralis]KAB0790125.1 hypothetical protein PPYR_15558 [Photinus pyralis]KAB0790316.1 hypothetical protein PPYR_15345 [Photinus pyralis]
MCSKRTKEILKLSAMKCGNRNGKRKHFKLISKLIFNFSPTESIDQVSTSAEMDSSLIEVLPALICGSSIQSAVNQTHQQLLLSTPLGDTILETFMDLQAVPPVPVESNEFQPQDRNGDYLELVTMQQQSPLCSIDENHGFEAVDEYEDMGEVDVSDDQDKVPNEEEMNTSNENGELEDSVTDDGKRRVGDGGMTTDEDTTRKHDVLQDDGSDDRKKKGLEVVERGLLKKIEPENVLSSPRRGHRLKERKKEKGGWNIQRKRGNK